jgi:hypothetical protein
MHINVLFSAKINWMMWVPYFGINIIVAEEIAKVTIENLPKIPQSQTQQTPRSSILPTQNTKRKKE